MKKIFCIILSFLIISTTAMPTLADTVYDFSDEAQAEFERQEMIEKGNLQKQDMIEIQQKHKLEKAKRKDVDKNGVYSQQDLIEPETKTYSGTVLTVPKGVEFEVVLQSSISSSSLANNDTIAATLSKDWYYNGVLIAPQGSVLYGKASDIKKAGYAYANGKLAMSFDEILTPNGDRIRLTSNKVYVEVEGNRAVKIATHALIGAVSGVVAGALWTLMTGGNVAHGIAVGSAVGASGGLINAGFQKGENAEVPAGTVLTVRLVQPAEVVPYE